MKKLFLIPGTVLLIGGSLLVSEAKAELEVSAEVEVHATADFYEPLGAEGEWIEVGTYGRCWHPRGVARDWRPYCEGHWILTDCGWYWESDEPWGWACYHYGSWAQDPTYGWYWVPGIEWAPAWVEWRSGGGFIGWAPRGPQGVVVAPELFAFVDAGHFHDPIRRSSVRVDVTVFKQTAALPEARRETRNIGGQSRNVVFNEGPSTATVEKATGKKAEAVPVQEAFRQTHAPASFKPGTHENGPAQPERTVVQPQNRTPVNPPGEQSPPKEERGIQPSRPHESPADRPFQPPSDQPVLPPVDKPKPPPIDRPVQPPGDQPIHPPVDRPLNLPKAEHPVSPPGQVRPVSPPPKQVQPVNPPREDRPATPAQEGKPEEPRHDKDLGQRRDGGEIWWVCQMSFVLLPLNNIQKRKRMSRLKHLLVIGLLVLAGCRGGPLPPPPFLPPPPLPLPPPPLPH